MGPFSDERLARRAAQGDRRAFDAIYRRYGQRLYRFCLALVGNREDAEDALQNTMVKAVRALPGEERRIELRPWLYRIARNESVEILRRRRPDSDLGPDLETGGDVTDRVMARERLRNLLGDLELLPERQRTVLLLRELAGLGFAEIGEALGTSSAVARQTLYEARLGLRQLERGREMRCAEVVREISDGDGRVARRREIRSHLRGCTECRAFRDEISGRRKDLAAIAPLPLAAFVGILKGVLGTKAGVGVAIEAGAGAAGTSVTTSVVVKSVATIAVATVVGASVADRGGLVDLPLPADEGGSAVAKSPGPTAPDGSSRPLRIAPPGALDKVRPAGATARGSQPVALADAVRVSPALVPSRPTSALPSAPSTPPTPGNGSGSPSQGESGPSQGPAPASSHGQQTAASKRPSHAGNPSAQGAVSSGQKESTPGRKVGQTEAPPGKPTSTPRATVPPGHEQAGPPPHPQADNSETGAQAPGQETHEQKSNGASPRNELP